MIDLVIPCYRRDQDLRFWLNSGLELLNTFCLSSIVLGCGSFVLVLANNGGTRKSSWKRYVSPEKSSLSGASLRLPHSKSILQLQCFPFTSADYLFFLDCDLRFTRSSFHGLLDSFNKPNAKRNVVYIRDIYEVGMASAQTIWSGELPVLSTDQNGSKYISIEHWTSVNTRPGFGNLICRRDDYVRCGGHDLMYQSYGWEDHDLLISLQLEGCLLMSASYAFHLTHDDSHRLLGGLTRDQCVLRSKRLFMDKYASLFR